MDTTLNTALPCVSLCKIQFTLRYATVICHTHTHAFKGLAVVLIHPHPEGGRGASHECNNFYADNTWSHTLLQSVDWIGIGTEPVEKLGIKKRKENADH